MVASRCPPCTMESKSKRKKGLHRWYFIVLAIGFFQIMFLLSIISYHRHNQMSFLHPTIPAMLHPATTHDDFYSQQLYSKVGNSTRKIPFSQMFTTNVNVTKVPHTNPFDKRHHQATFKRPLLMELVPHPKNNNILQDVNFLLDFAIIGFAKVCQELVWSGKVLEMQF
jgi:hypothetical protein